MLRKAPLSEIANIKFSTITPRKDVGSCKELQWITATNLLQYNTVSSLIYDERFAEDASLTILHGDIIIKRISPSFINYIDEDYRNVYAHNNLIIVRANKEIYNKYLAYILEREIVRTAKANQGATIPSISKNDLETIKIPIISLENQKALGEIWFHSIELKKLNQQLIDLEYKKIKYTIDNYINRMMEEK